MPVPEAVVDTEAELVTVDVPEELTLTVTVGDAVTLLVSEALVLEVID